MRDLTLRQKQILDFIQRQGQTGQPCPSIREIARHFKFRSTRAVTCHLQALVRKGALERMPGRARSLRVVSPLQELRSPVADIPIYGDIRAGLPSDRRQEARGCISIDTDTLSWTWSA